VVTPGASSTLPGTFIYNIIVVTDKTSKHSKATLGELFFPRWRLCTEGYRFGFSSDTPSSPAPSVIHFLPLFTHIATPVSSTHHIRSRTSRRHRRSPDAGYTTTSASGNPDPGILQIQMAVEAPRNLQPAWIRNRASQWPRSRSPRLHANRRSGAYNIPARTARGLMLRFWRSEVAVALTLSMDASAPCGRIPASDSPVLNYMSSRLLLLG
jgi:hypothetical protein